MKDILILILMLLVFTSCEDVLVEDPEDRLVEEQFYQTVEDAETAIFAAYDPLREDQLFGARYPAHLECLADYVNGRGSYANVSNYDGLNGTNIGRTDNVYIRFYRSIIRANIVIRNVDELDVTQETRDVLSAEARFLRAFSYFHLVRLWGDVPVQDVIDSSLPSPRVPVDQIYNDVIIPDLEFAENALPATRTGPGLGRATSGSAKLLLADVYLTREQWADARTKADEVIQSGNYSLVEVNVADDFNDLFGPEIEPPSEEVFGLHFTRVEGEGMRWPTFCNDGRAGFSVGGFRVPLGNLNSPILIDWSSADLRKQWGVYTFIINDNGDTLSLRSGDNLLFSKFRDPEAVEDNAHGCDFPVYRYAEALLIFAEADNMDNGGPTATALERLNMVRRRAYGQDINTASSFDVPPGLSQQAFRDSVLMERAHEFTMEGKRWFDLTRTGTARSQIEATGKNFNDIMLLHPIPLSEIENNPALDQQDQNPGYE